MKKIAKLSLVAAVAVAGLSTTSSAASLEEAIKGVDVSGQFRYRLQEQKSEINGVSQNTNRTGTDVEVEVGVKVPVNDNVTAVFKIDNANDDGDTANTKGSVDIEDYYFSYANGPLTVNFGQQNIPGRMTDAAQGDGIVALYNMGAFTVGAAGFTNHNVDLHADTDGDGEVDAGEVDAGNAHAVLSVIAMGNVGPVSLLGQYANVDDVADAYNVKADASVSMLKVGVEYTSLELDNAAAAAYGAAGAEDDRSTLKVYASAKAGIVSGSVTYAATGDNGSGSIDSQINASTETPSEYLLWNIGTSNRSDAELVAIDASVALTDKISVRAAFVDGEDKNGAADRDLQETLGQISYKMSKNLNTYIRYAEYEEGTTDSQRGRVEVRYSF